MFIQLPDGSLVDESGKILLFSDDRFIRDIVKGDCCFICGMSPDQVEFNREHILPDWILSRYKLYDKQINLPNDAGLTYGRYTIPCCAPCNSRMSEVFETPISRLHEGGYNAIVEHVRTNGPWLIFTWLALIFFKAHLKDTALRFHLDVRRGVQKIGDLYPWEDLYHIHCVARSFYTAAKLDAAVLGSVFVLPAKTGTPFGDFDYSDLYDSKTMLLRLGEIVFIAALMDSCAAFNVLYEWMNKITGRFSAIQIREFMSHVAVINLHMEDRPDFASRFLSAENQYIITAEHPDKVKLREIPKRDLGEIMYKLCRQAVDCVPPEDRETFIESLRDGRRTFLFDENGNFISNSI